MAEPRPVLGASCPSPGAERAGPAGASSLERCDVAAVTPEPLTPLANYRRHGQQEALAHVVGPATVICHGLASVRLLYFCAVPVAAALLLVNEPSGRAPDLPAETTHAAQHCLVSLGRLQRAQAAGARTIL